MPLQFGREPLALRICRVHLQFHAMSLALFGSQLLVEFIIGTAQAGRFGSMLMKMEPCLKAALVLGLAERQLLLRGARLPLRDLEGNAVLFQFLLEICDLLRAPFHVAVRRGRLLFLARLFQKAKVALTVGLRGDMVKCKDPFAKSSSDARAAPAVATASPCTLL